MTILSKVETLIDYAKFGMFQCQLYKGKTAPLHFPRAISSYVANWNSGWNYYATKITGHLKTFGGTACMGSDKPTIEVDLPELTSIGSASWTNYTSTPNTTLKVCKLPSLRNINVGNWLKMATALEYLEVGALVQFTNTSISGCTALHTFKCGEGTNCNLFLYHSKAYTQECLHNIIDNLADANGLSRTLHIGSENVAKISDEYLTKLQNKNWDLL